MINYPTNSLRIMYDLAFIIPCYNETERINDTFLEYYNYFDTANFFRDKKVAFILVNDGSTDHTLKIIEKYREKSNEKITIKICNLDKNQGKGCAIKNGINSTDAKIYGFTDADLSYSPNLIEQFMREFPKYDLVIGKRIFKKEKKYDLSRQLISNSLQKIVKYLFNLETTDTQCGFKFFSKKTVEKIIPKSKEGRFAFDVELILLTHRNNLQTKIKSIDFTHRHGSTIAWKDGLKYIFDIIIIWECQTAYTKKFFFLLFLISFILVLSLFGNIIFLGYFFSDDFTWLWYGQKMNNNLIKILTYKMSTFYSPVINAFYSIMYSIFEISSKVYFIFGLLVHILVTFLSGIFILQTTRSKLASIFSVIIIAIAGTAYEPLVWIGANMHSIATLFILCCLIFYQKYLTNQTGKYLIFSTLFFLLALGTKETAIVTITLLFVLFFYNKTKFSGSLKNNKHIIFWGIITLTTTIYAYQQYLWQKTSVWVEANIWQINLISLIKTPIVMFDIFIPVSLLNRLNIENIGIYVWLISTLFLLFILIKFHKIKLVWLGFFWMIISISPTIFFKTELWWQPLASRYTYLPRIGMVIILVAILQYFLKKYKKNKFILSTIVIIIILGLQLFFTLSNISSNYPYVYSTGKNLVNEIKQLKNREINKIYFLPDRPFENNTAHIVGAASVIANIEEEKIVFTKEKYIPNMDKNDFLFYWNHQKNKYETSQKNIE
ncbi:MAG: glycosyltransferase [Candidatus Magasanikbacteria bacterium]|nr:glycosyltransferase [Candidatus Magasanikbacteria bacterium]